jgi:hypothetical protein
MVSHGALRLRQGATELRIQAHIAKKRREFTIASLIMPLMANRSIDRMIFSLVLAQFAAGGAGVPNPSAQANQFTGVSISGEDFQINGKPAYAGRGWNGHRIEGLLLNSPMVSGIFDDLNPKTVGMWAYPDTRKWEPDRNTNEFVAAMPSWRAQGLLAFTINLQGGSPQGHSQGQPSWGFFDYRRKNESFQNGFQGIPGDWTIDSTRKTDFFNYVGKITGSSARHCGIRRAASLNKLLPFIKESSP